MGQVQGRVQIVIRICKTRILEEILIVTFVLSRLSVSQKLIDMSFFDLNFWQEMSTSKMT